MFAEVNNARYYLRACKSSQGSLPNVTCSGTAWAAMSMSFFSKTRPKEINWIKSPGTISLELMFYVLQFVSDLVFLCL